MHEQTMDQITGDYCQKHRMPLLYICSSPYCNYYRKLCKECLNNDHNHKDYHHPLGKAYDQTKNKIDDLLMGLKALKMKKRQEMEININNNPGLSDIESKLDEIRNMINKKIDFFRQNLRKIYFQHIKVKLDELEEIISKSEEFLLRQKQQLKKTRNVRSFFVNDFDHQLKFYKSYLEEIFIKKIRNFRSGLDADKVLKLIVSFQQNLEEIFMISKQRASLDKHHLFFGDSKVMKKYQLTSNNALTVSTCSLLLGQSSEINVSNPYYTYKWQEDPQSTYYHQNQCFYIIGEGKKQSKKIMKYEDGRSGIQKFTLVGNLQTERSNFSICLVNGEIYIVGGLNQKQGCLVKCQKFVPSYNNKVYIISSLNQRSAFHSVCNYLDKYILKFGGVDRIQQNTQALKEIKETQIPIQNLHPEIYSIQKQQWQIIEFNINKQSLNFGLNPVIYCLPSQKDKIIILGGSSYYNQNHLIISQKESKRSKFQVSIRLEKHEIQEIRLKQKKFNLNKKYYIFPKTIVQSKDKKIYCLVKDTTKIETNIQVHALNTEL